MKAFLEWLNLFVAITIPALLFVMSVYYIWVWLRQQA